MNKRSAIAKVNSHVGYGLLHGPNTSFANINASKGVWWLNVNPNKFNKDLHLLLAKKGQDGLIWLTIEANTFPAPERVFRTRQDNGLIDIEISTEPSQYLTDVKSGGTGYNFTRHVAHEWELTTQSVFGETIIHNDIQVVSGSAVFEGTQVPIKELHAHMHKDWNLYGFLYKFPSVSMEQALFEMERQARETVQRITLRDEKIADGTLVFQRSDVPVGHLFDYLTDVKGLKDFHWDFPSVFREDTYDAIITSGRILELDAYRGVTNGIVDSDRSYVSGAPRFVGTRLPIRILFDLLADACTLKDFSYNFSGASREQLMGILRLAHEVLEREVCAPVTR